MNFLDAKEQIRSLFLRVNPKDIPRLIDWLKSSDDLDDALVDNQKIILQSISEDLRSSLPMEAVLPSESLAIEKTQLKPQPTVHVDAFLYDDATVDTLCEEGKMSRNYCLNCGSHKTAPLDFISHSFSISELQFLFQYALPDLTGKVVVDVGSRLGAVLYGGYLYSSAARLIGVEINADFFRLQTLAVEKYNFTDRIQVVQADICTQDMLMQSADVLIMNNVFEYFLQPCDQIKAWQFIIHNFRKKGALLVTVPSIQESLSALQGEMIDPCHWVEELTLDHNIYLGKDSDPDSQRDIHLYRVQ
ncbi:uncharacterized protein FYW47_003333 [Aplochiton taeniatus]